MQTTSIPAISIGKAGRTGRPFALFGLLVTALVPAVFWVALYAAIASGLGYTNDLGTLLFAGFAIAAFLGACFAILASGSR